MWLKSSRRRKSKGSGNEPGSFSSVLSQPFHLLPLICLVANFLANHAFAQDYQNDESQSREIHHLDRRAAIVSPFGNDEPEERPNKIETIPISLNGSTLSRRLSFPVEAEKVSFITTKKGFRFPEESNRDGRTIPQNESESQDPSTSRKAAPDVQDIIDGIVKLLGGKVHNPATTPGQNQQQNSHQNQHQNQQQNQQQPQPSGAYNLFNPTKPIFFPAAGKPNRINNRGPPLVTSSPSSGLKHVQGTSGNNPTGFEAIPLEALTGDFNLSQTKYGPPFPLMQVHPEVTSGHSPIPIPLSGGFNVPSKNIPHTGSSHERPNVLSGPSSAEAIKNSNERLKNSYERIRNESYGQDLFTGSSSVEGDSGEVEEPLPLSPTNLGTSPFHNSFSSYVTPNQHQPVNGQYRPSEQSYPIEDDSLENDESPEINTSFNTNNKKPVKLESTYEDVPPTFVYEATSSSFASTSTSTSSSYFTTSTMSTTESAFDYTEISSSTYSSFYSSVEIRPTTVATAVQMSTTHAPQMNSEVNAFVPSQQGHVPRQPVSYPNAAGGVRQSNNRNDNGPFMPPVAKATQIPSLRPGIVIHEGSPSKHVPTITNQVEQPKFQNPHHLPHPKLQLPSPGQGYGSVEVVTAGDLQGSGGKVGEIFDITVTAKQNYGGSGATGQPYVIPVDLKDEVITSPGGDQQFVSIDGKRTYFNLQPNTASGLGTVSMSQAPMVTSSSSPVTHKSPFLNFPQQQQSFPVGGTRQTQSVSTTLNIGSSNRDSLVTSKAPANIVRRPPNRRPSIPSVRIDTCIVGDDSTCNAEQHEICRTESGVSSCLCRAGFARRRHREPCKAVVSLVVSLRLDKLGEKKLGYNADYFNPNSDTYQSIEWETILAFDSTLSETSLSPAFVGSKLDAIGFDGRHAVVNSTILIEENPTWPTSQVKRELQRQLIQSLTKNKNNFGKSQLWVEGPISALAAITDVNECEKSELNDCNSKAKCVNNYGSFECKCEAGYGDPYEKDKRRSGRKCESCSGKAHCNSRGECLIENGLKVCKCAGNYYGAACDLDGEVLAVAIGASVSAFVIIGLTLACLCMWSRRWKREEQKAAQMSRTLFGGMASQALSYLSKNSMNSSNPYQQHLTIDDRLRWAQVADTNLNTNIYVQNDPMSLHGGPGMMGPSMMETQAMMGPGVRRSDDTSEDLFDDSRCMGNKRPRSRASQLQGGGIYYDVEHEPANEIYSTRPTLVPFPAQFCVTQQMPPFVHPRGYYN